MTRCHPGQGEGAVFVKLSCRHTVSTTIDWFLAIFDLFFAINH
jgi:hypothetical protein